MSDEEFWYEIEKQFADYEYMLSDLKFPEAGDIELYQLSILTEGAMGSNYNDFFYAQPDQKLKEIIGHMAKLGLPIPEKFKDKLFLYPAPDDLQGIITEAIRARTISGKFARAWGEYLFSSALLTKFISDERFDDHHKYNIVENIPFLVGKYIFAFWMIQHWTGDASKEAASDELNDHIQEVLDADDGLPAWKKQALESMLMKDGGGIKKTYTDITAEDIKAMVSRAEKYRHLFEL